MAIIIPGDYAELVPGFIIDYTINDCVQGLAGHEYHDYVEDYSDMP